MANWYDAAPAQTPPAPSQSGNWWDAAPPQTPAETKWREPGMIAPVQFSEDGQFRWAVPQLVTETIKAIEGPGKALQGEYGLEHDPNYGFTTITDDMISDTMGTAGLGLTPLSPAAAAGAQFGKTVIPGNARRMLERSLTADGVPLGQVGPRLAALGDNAVVADLGPNVRARAAAIATAPGNGAKTVVDALSARRAGANPRIQGDVNDILGPATTPKDFAQGIRAQQTALSPEYEAAFADAIAVDTSPIALNLDSMSVVARGEVQSIASKVRKMLNVVGTEELDPDPRTLFAVRQELDDLYGNTTGNNARRAITEIRGQVDALLAQSVPGIKDADTKFAGLARQREGFEDGMGVLDTGKGAARPSDLESVFAGLEPEVAEAFSAGARAEIDRIIGTTANDITAMKRILQGEGNWNRERLMTVFGKEKADKLLDVLEREAAFRATEDLALNGSRTQVLKAAQDEIFGTGPKPNPFKSAANFQFGNALGDTADRALGWIYRAKRGATNENLANALMMGAGDAQNALSAKRVGPFVQQGGINALRLGAQYPR